MVSPERVLIDYTVLTEGKPIHVRYTRIGQISEREAIAQGKERDEYLQRRAQLGTKPTKGA